MLVHQLQKWLTTPIDKTFSPQKVFWFCLALTLSASYAIPGMQEAFSNNYVVQDDARQHLFWMRRFLDPDLFPQDWIADYYQSASPYGFSLLYQIAARFGIDPIWLSKLLPLPLGLLTSGYCFAFSLQILPVPTVGFISTLVFNQILWDKAALVNATPRAFFYPLLLVFFYYIFRGSLWGVIIAIALQGLFYPPALLITGGVLFLRCFHWKKGLPQFSLDWDNILLCGIGMGLVLVFLLPYVFDKSQFGPTISVIEAKTLPEFLQGGRTEFFVDSPWKFWFNSHRSGLMIWPLKPPLIYGAFLLPIMAAFRERFPLINRITSKFNLSIQVLAVGLGLFFGAHLLLFKLYLPHRYMQPLDILLSVWAAIAWVILLDAALQGIGQKQKISLKSVGLFWGVYLLILTVYYIDTGIYPGGKKVFILMLLLGSAIAGICGFADAIVKRTLGTVRPNLGSQGLALASSTLLIVAIAIHPYLIPGFPHNIYKVATTPQLYDFLDAQPKDTLIASLTEEANNIPTFAQRSILVAREYALPYQVGYYKKIRQRALDTIAAQYSLDREEVNRFIEKYGIDFWPIDRDAFTPEYIADPKSYRASWLRQYQPAAKIALERLEAGQQPFLAQVLSQCVAIETEQLFLVNAQCLLKAE